MRFVKGPLGGELRDLQRRMDRILDEFMEFSQPMMQLAGHHWHPATDIYETENEVVVLVELPGVDINKVEILLHDDLLHVSGERHLPDTGCARRHQLELSTGKFERAVRLPCAVDVERVEAKYRDGILTITCPKSRASKNIEVQEGSTG